MRCALVFIIIITLFESNLISQINFSHIESNLKIEKADILNKLIFSSSNFTIEFKLEKNMTLLPQENMIKIDNQIIQLIALKYNHNILDFNDENINNQKQILETYSKYELEYFKNDLGIKILNQNSQWVKSKSKFWLIWYFKVDNYSLKLENQTKIQLFATTIINDKVLIINAPILAESDFSSASGIVNEMMENLLKTK